MFLAFIAAFALPMFEVRERIPLPGVGAWGTPIFDKPSHRLFVPRAGKVQVVDVASRRLVGEVENVPDARGVALVPERDLGFVSDGSKNEVVVFDLTICAEIKRILVPDEPDAIIYDPRTRRVLVANRRGRTLTMIDPSDLTARQKIALSGSPRAIAIGERGAAFVAVEGGGIERLDLGHRRSTALWTGNATGLAYDDRRDLLYAVGPESRLDILDPKTGTVRASVTASKGGRAVLSDFELGLAFIANAAGGSLSVIHAKSATLVQTLATAPGVQAAAIDPDDHRLYLLASDRAKKGGAEILVVARVRGQ